MADAISHASFKRSFSCILRLLWWCSLYLGYIALCNIMFPSLLATGIVLYIQFFSTLTVVYVLSVHQTRMVFKILRVAVWWRGIRVPPWYTDWRWRYRETQPMRSIQCRRWTTVARILPVTSHTKLVPMMMYRTAREIQEYLLLLLEKLPTHRTIIDRLVVRGEWYRHYSTRWTGRRRSGFIFAVFGFVVIAVDIGWESVCTMMLWYYLLFLEKCFILNIRLHVKGTVCQWNLSTSFVKWRPKESSSTYPWVMTRNKVGWKSLSMYVMLKRGEIG